MRLYVYTILAFVLIFTAGEIYGFTRIVSDNEICISYQVNLKKQNLKLYWKDDQNKLFKNFGRLKAWLTKNNQTLVFAMNGGMYHMDNSPVGLFIEKGKTVTPLNKKSGQGNFFIKPNGVFYITTENKAVICEIGNFANAGKIKYATQSGPMLVINGKIRPGFTRDSKNLNIRNGVGILPDNTIIFAMSKKEISFYDFARYFKDAGCKNALYLDGYVSKTYLPEKKWIQLGGDFGVIIAVTTDGL